MSKSHPEQWAVRQVAERPDGSLVTALREFATTQIADCGGPVAIMATPAASSSSRENTSRRCSP